MIIFRIFIFLLSSLFLISGFVTMVSPDVNTIFLPIEVGGMNEAHFVRTYAGFILAVGYLSMRFLYSSSKVQIGSIVFYVICFMLVSKIFSFIYDGVSAELFSTFVIGVIFAISLYAVQKSRKNQIDYNL